MKLLLLLLYLCHVFLPQLSLLHRQCVVGVFVCVLLSKHIVPQLLLVGFIRLVFQLCLLGSLRLTNHFVLDLWWNLESIDQSSLVALLNSSLAHNVFLLIRNIDQVGVARLLGYFGVVATLQWNISTHMK